MNFEEGSKGFSSLEMQVRDWNGIVRLSSTLTPGTAVIATAIAKYVKIGIDPYSSYILRPRGCTAEAGHGENVDRNEVLRQEKS